MPQDGTFLIIIILRENTKNIIREAKHTPVVHWFQRRSYIT